jgi:hypothetical protein
MATIESRGLRRAGTAAAYLLFLLVTVEAVSRVLLVSDWVMRHVGREDPTVHRINWVRRHGSAQSLTYAFDVYDSLRGWALAPGIAHMAVFNGKVLNSTLRGIRGTVEVPYARVGGKRRILVFGDSYTFGDEVSDQETYAADLGRILPNTDVINMGVHGYGHDQMLEYLRSEGVKYRPDVVLIGYVWFDQYRNLFAFNNYAKPKFELRDGQLVLTGIPVPRPAQVLAHERWRSGAWDMMHILTEMTRWRVGVNQARAEALTQAILDEIVRTAREIRAVPVLTYLPVIEELDDTSSVPSARERFLKTYCDSRGVACLLLRPTFAREYQRGERFNVPGHHWGPAAHLVAARAIAQFLSEHQLVQVAAERPTP